MACGLPWTSKDLLSTSMGLSWSRMGLLWASFALEWAPVWTSMYLSRFAHRSCVRFHRVPLVSCGLPWVYSGLPTCATTKVALFV